MDKTRICIITTAHDARDDRIFHKQALSLAQASFEVSMIAGWTKEMDSGPVKKMSLPVFKGKVSRILCGSFWALQLALKEKAAVYHFHDPELLPLGVVLKIFGKRVIYDVHEDYSRKVLSRCLPQPLAWLASHSLRGFEAACAWTFDHIVAADSHVASLFAPRKTTVIANYPPVDFVNRKFPTREPDDGVFRMVYVGGINEIRGIGKTLDALDLITDTPVEFHLAGNISGRELARRIESHPRVVYHGVLPWERVNGVIARADVGLVLFQPVPAFKYYPGENIIKLWEFLGLGLPVIISDFPRLKKLIEDLGSGIAVDSADPSAIAAAIRQLRDQPELRRRLGANGRNSVLRERNWDGEARKLAAIYRGLGL